jgi:spore maturation protein CgeB
MNKQSKKKLNILVYGEPYEWAMAANLIQSFKEFGHHAEIFDYTQSLYRTKEYTLVNRVLDRVLYYKISKQINNNVLNVLSNKKYDILLVLKGIHLYPETLLTAKKSVGLIVNWNPDDFFNSVNNSKYLLKSFDIYDYIFTARGHLYEEYIRNGAKRVVVLNWYYLPKYQYPIDVTDADRQKYASDVVFVGTWSKRREEFMIALSGFANVKIWGGGWENASKKLKMGIECRPPIFSKEMAKVIRCSKININILTQENRDETNCRNFETLACNGFQLAERSPAILELFEDGKEIACFSTPEELASQCIYYLENERQREEIRDQGYEKLVSGNHSMLDRAKQIVDTLLVD